MAKKISILHTAKDVVEAFGGTKETAEWAGIGMPAVSNWLADGWIPPGWYLSMSEKLRQRGFDVDPAVFRQMRAKTDA